MRVLPVGGRLLLPVALCFSEAVVSTSVVSHYTSFYPGFLSWSCEKAEIELRKQAGHFMRYFPRSDNYSPLPCACSSFGY
jgi:hypothetical protein